MHASRFSGRASPRLLGLVVSTWVGAWMPLAARAQPTTDPVGLSASVSIDNGQPSLCLKHLVVLGGLYPSLPSSTSLANGNTATIGELRLFAGTLTLSSTELPEARGQFFLIANYSSAFTMLGTQFGGNGNTTFALPNLSGRLAVGLNPTGTSFYSIGRPGGEQSVLLTAANLPAHHHTITEASPTPETVTNYQPSLTLRYFINNQAEVRATTWNRDVEGWLPADGRSVSATVYTNLFNLIGYTYGGSGSSFNLPDLRGRVPVGAGVGPGGVVRTVGSTFGSPTIALSTANLPAHEHGLPGGGTTFSLGNGEPFDTHQPSIALKAGIVTSGSFPSTNSNPFASTTVLGEVRLFASNTLPSGIVPADGSLISVSGNSALFAVIGTQFGGNGVTQFALPNLQGRAILGTSSVGAAGLVGATAGVPARTLSAAEIPLHSHTLIAEPGAVPNASFEADMYWNWPGYASSNGGRITGWAHGGDVGLNGRAFEPFSTGGAIPEGSQVGLLQSTFGLPASLSTRIYGLTTGARYTVRFRTNMRRDYATPVCGWNLNGSQSIAMVASPFVAAPGQYYTVQGAFTATGPTADLALWNTTNDDSTLLVDAFEIVPGGDEPWKAILWNGDNSSNIGAASTLWAYRFGDGPDAVLNGVTLPAIAGTSPAVAGRFEGSGFTGSLLDDTSVVMPAGSASALITSDALRGGFMTLSLQGLTSGQAYHLTVLLSTPGAFPEITMASQRDSSTVNLLEIGAFTGIRLEYGFTATAATESFSLSTKSGSLDLALCGLALCLPKPDLRLVEPVSGALDFGSLPYGSTSGTLPIRLRNEGDANLIVQTGTFVGGNNGSFAFAANPAGLSIPPGGEQQIDARFVGVWPRLNSSTAQLVTNDPDVPTTSVSVTGNTLYDLGYWTAAYFPADGLNPLIVGPDADPDGDGIPNRVEYGSGTNPAVANRSGPLRLSYVGSNVVARVLLSTLAQDQIRRVERSADFITWTNVLEFNQTTVLRDPAVALSLDFSTGDWVLTGPPNGPTEYWRFVVEPVAP